MLEWAQELVRVLGVVLESELRSVWESVSGLELMGLRQPLMFEAWA